MEDNTLQPGILSQSPKRSKFLIFFVVSILIIVGGFGAWQFFGSEAEEVETSTETPTPTKFQIPTDEPTAQSTPEVTETPEPTSVPPATSTPKPTVNPIDKITGLDRSELTVEVQNGSGVAGAAGKASETLKALGYNVVAAGNADNFDYENTVIQVKSAKSEFLSLLKKDLGTDYSIGTTSADLSTGSSADALVIIGK